MDTSKIIKPVLIGGGIGGILMALFTVGVNMSGVSAQDQPATKIIAAATNTLFPPQPVERQYVKFSDEEYLVSAAPGYSLTATATSTVRKIGYGENQMVMISTTSSGVYSSDGLASPHFRYPGIEVAKIQRIFPYFFQQGELAITGWAPGHGWVAVPTESAGSIIVIR